MRSECNILQKNKVCRLLTEERKPAGKYVGGEKRKKEISTVCSKFCLPVVCLILCGTYVFNSCWRVGNYPCNQEKNRAKKVFAAVFLVVRIPVGNA